MSTTTTIALIISGLLVGFINTLAGGGTIISLSLFMFLGLPPAVANGTNRIAVIIQNLVAVGNFRKQKIIDTEKGIKLAIPTTIGSIVGASIGANINQHIFEISFGIIMLAMLTMLIFKPERWLKGNPILADKPVSLKSHLLFFLIGIYGGFLHVGVGYFILAAAVLGSGLDLIKANAIKNLIVLCYVPFSLLVFVINNQVNWKYGLIHAIGNVIGAYVASRWAIKFGSNFIRWIMILLILVSIAQTFGAINLKAAIQMIK
jgi:Predicted permeases